MRRPIKWGLVLALTLLLWTAAVHLVGVYTVHLEYARGVDIAVTVIPIAVVTLALTEQRRAQPGSLSLGAGVLTDVAVAAIAAPITVAGMRSWLERMPTTC